MQIEKHLFQIRKAQRVKICLNCLRGWDSTIFEFKLTGLLKNLVLATQASLPKLKCSQ